MRGPQAPVGFLLGLWTSVLKSMIIMKMILLILVLPPRMKKFGVLHGSLFNPSEVPY